MRRKCLATDTQDGKKRAPPITVRCLVAPSYSAFFRKPFLSWSLGGFRGHLVTNSNELCQVRVLCYAGIVL